MKLSKQQEERLVMIIQAVIIFAALVLSVFNSTKTQTKNMRKAMAKNARHVEKLNKLEYRLQKKSLKKQYKGTAAQK